MPRPEVICRKCGRPIARRQWEGLVVWGHIDNPRNNHHYAKPQRIAPETEGELREAFGK
jgi:RNA polymerase subunit RPABC4/transcription elongation factor Spt4